MNVIVETKKVDDAPEKPVAPKTEVAGPPPTPAPKSKSYQVVEAVKRISINGQITSLPAGQIISDLGYDILKLQKQGVKLELFEG
jgi:hypothetical protein